jgi:DNA-binding transcriptional MerR regulator
LVAAGRYGQHRLNADSDRLDVLDQRMGKLAGIEDRVAKIEQHGTALFQEVSAFTDRLAGLDQKLSARLEQAQRTTRDLGVSLRREVRSVMSAQAEQNETRFAKLETSFDRETLQRTQLEREVAQLNRQLAAANDNINSLQNATTRESQQLRQEIHATDGRLTQVASFNNRPRERFEVSRGETQEIAPNILLHITRIDVRYRRFAGWVQLVDQGRFLWLRDQGALESIGFYAGEMPLRHDLIVTGLTSSGATGYLIFPRLGESAGVEIVPRLESELVRNRVVEQQASHSGSTISSVR